MEFLVPKKFRGTASEWFPLLRGRKCSFRGIPRSKEESIPKLGTQISRKNQFKKQPKWINKMIFPSFSLPRNALERNSERLLLFLVHVTEFRAFFSSAEWFGTEFRQLLLFLFYCRKFLFHGMVRNGIQRVFCSAEQPEFRRTNQLFSLFRLLRNNFFVENCQPQFLVTCVVQDYNIDGCKVDAKIQSL